MSSFPARDLIERARDLIAGTDDVPEIGDLAAVDPEYIRAAVELTISNLGLFNEDVYSYDALEELILGYRIADVSLYRAQRSDNPEHQIHATVALRIRTYMAQHQVHRTDAWIPALQEMLESPDNPDGVRNAARELLITSTRRGRGGELLYSAVHALI